MLRTLYIENIAVIEKTSIDFENGLKAVSTWKEMAAKSPVFTARYDERKAAFEKRWGVK